MDPQPETRIARQLDAGGGGTKLDPESLAGTRELFVLYNLINDQGLWEVHRCKTGITLPNQSSDYWIVD